MINRKLLKWDDMRISDDAIIAIESALELTLDERDRPPWRSALQELVRAYIFTWTFRPLSLAEKSTPQFKEADKENKRRDKRQQELQRDIVRTFRKALSLMFEELRCQGDYSNGLLAKICDLHSDGENRYMNTIDTCILIITALEHETSVNSFRERKRGRPADGLNEFIKTFARLVNLAGHPLSAPIDPDSGKPGKTPFVKAMKLLIDALPTDCPKPTEQAIADRIKDGKLLAGLTRQSPERRRSRSDRRRRSTIRGLN